MWNSMRWMVVLVAACSFDEAEPDTATTQLASTTVTRLHVNGRFAFTFLNEGDSTNGSLNASKDRLADTTGLDFSYVEPHPTDPDILVAEVEQIGRAHV